VGVEIERKFLVKDDGWRGAAKGGERYRQGYVAVGPPAAVRVRIMGGRAILNLKQATTDIARDEFEYGVPVAEAEAILARLCCGRIVEKTRYKVPYAGFTWEVDVFEGRNAGLVVAEIELASETQAFEQPPWLGKEVSGDVRYFNSSLSTKPYTEW